MEDEDVIDVMADMEEEVPMRSPPTPDPMAGIGYWESPGNSPKPTRKFAFYGQDDEEVKEEEEDVKDDEDFAHQRSRRLLEAHNQGQRRPGQEIMGEIPEGEFNPEVGMTDRELVLRPITELNQRLREKMVSKDVQNRIKQRRRTLKNRSYAAEGRKTWLSEEETLQNLKDGHTARLGALKKEKKQLKRDSEHLRRELETQKAEDQEWRRSLKT